MNKIKLYREMAGLTQSELADKAGIGTNGAVCNYEKGRRIPRTKTLQAIHKVLVDRIPKRVKLRLEDLIDDDEPASG